MTDPLSSAALPSYYRGRRLLIRLAYWTTAVVLALSATKALAQPKNGFRDDRFTPAASSTRGAQPISSERRRELVDELLRSLIQSEMDRGKSGAGDTGPGIARTAQPKAISSRDMTEVRRNLEDFYREAAKLTAELDDLMRRLPGIRPFFGDALKIRARSYVLARKAGEARDQSEVAAEFQQLDKDWRNLAHRLSGVRGLSRAAEQHIANLNGYDQAIAKVLHINPQLDRAELIRAAASLSTDVHNLLEDVEIELPPTQARQDLLYEGRRVEHSAKLVSQIVADGEKHEQVVAEYRRFQKSWETFAAKLRPIDNRYVDRGVRRISNIDHALRELLWLPHQVDRSKMVELAETLQNDIDEFFVRAPLKLLIQLPNSDNVLAISDQFYGVCENLVDAIKRGESQTELVDTYGYVDSAWASFQTMFKPMKSQSAQIVLRDIEHSIVALRQSLHVSGGFDRRKALELAATLDNLADHLARDARHWLNDSRVGYSDDARRALARFATSAHQFHQDMVKGADARQLDSESVQLVEQWRTAHGYVTRCQTSDRGHLLLLTSRITPALVELRTALTPGFNSLSASTGSRGTRIR